MFPQNLETKLTSLGVTARNFIHKYTKKKLAKNLSGRVESRQAKYWAWSRLNWQRNANFTTTNSAIVVANCLANDTLQLDEITTNYWRQNTQTNRHDEAKRWNYWRQYLCCADCGICLRLLLAFLCQLLNARLNFVAQKFRTRGIDETTNGKLQDVWFCIWYFEMIFAIPVTTL